NRGVASVVLANAGFDVADEVGTVVRALGEDAPAEAGEDGDQGAAEGQADQGMQCTVVAEKVGGQHVVTGDTEESEADHQHAGDRSEEHTSELQSRENLVCRLLLEK